MKKTLLKSVLIFITVLALFAGCTRRNSSSKSPTSIKLNDIESRMFQYPENLDSLISMVDTVNLTQCDIARVYMIKGYFNYWNGNYDTSINELAKADVIFQKVGDNYYTNLNNLIKAFLFELLDLDNNAAKLYVSCNVYFEKNHLEKFKFYSTLGLLRFSKQLNLHKEVLIEVINKAIKELNQPIYSGLYYAALGNLETKDSLKTDYYEKSKESFSLIKSWNRVYTQELNILFAKIRLDPSDQMLKYYDQLSEKYNFYNPTAHQKLKYKYARAYLYAKQGKNSEAIAVASELLKEPGISKFPDIESYCVNLLSVLNMRFSNYKDAYFLLARDNELQEKIKESMQNSRILALGAYYKYSELEMDKLNLKLRIQKIILYMTIAMLVFIVAISSIWILLKRSNHKQEILKLKNVEIEDQISNLIFSLDNQEHKNAQLISQVEDLKLQYKDSFEISKFLKAIDQNQITSWMEYEACFIKLRPGWLERIKMEIPELTPIHLKYCMCLYFNLNNSTIANLCNVSTEAIKSGKKRIRDKFSLDDATEIYIFLKTFD